MSIKLISKVWDESKQKGTPLLCLLALADFSNDEGCAYPSIESLAKKTRTKARNIQYIIQKLVKDGEVAVEIAASKYGTNLYSIIIGKPKHGVQPDAPGGCKTETPDCTRGGAIQVRQIAPEPLLTVIPIRNKPPNPPEGADLFPEAKVEEPKSTGPTIEEQAEAIYQAYPLKAERKYAIKCIVRVLKTEKGCSPDFFMEKVRLYAKSSEGRGKYCPNPSTWFNKGRYNDDPAIWEMRKQTATPGMTQKHWMDTDVDRLLAESEKL